VERGQPEVVRPGEHVAGGAGEGVEALELEAGEADVRPQVHPVVGGLALATPKKRLAPNLQTNLPFDANDQGLPHNLCSLKTHVHCG